MSVGRGTQAIGLFCTSAPISRKLHRLFLSEELYHESFRTCKVCLFKKYHYLCVLPIAIFILIYTYNENSETLAGHDSSAMVQHDDTTLR